MPRADAVITDTVITDTVVTHWSSLERSSRARTLLTGTAQSPPPRSPLLRSSPIRAHRHMHTRTHARTLTPHPRSRRPGFRAAGRAQLPPVPLRNFRPHAKNSHPPTHPANPLPPHCLHALEAGEREGATVAASRNGGWCGGGGGGGGGVLVNSHRESVQLTVSVTWCCAADLHLIYT